jgi:hypothetical protein
MIRRIALAAILGMLCPPALTASATFKPSPSSQPKPGSLSWVPIVECVVMGVTLAIVIFVGMWYNARQRRAAALWLEEPILDIPIEEIEEPPAPRIAIRCVACRKILKAKANLIGLKVKCPQCAKIMLVPRPDAKVKLSVK